MTDVDKAPDPMTLAVARFVARVAYRLNRESIEACRQEASEYPYGSDRDQPDDHSIKIARSLLGGWDVEVTYEAEVKRRTDGAEARMQKQKDTVIKALTYLAEVDVKLGYFERAAGEARKLAIELGVPSGHI